MSGVRAPGWGFCGGWFCQVLRLVVGHEYEVVADDVDAERREEEEDRDPELPIGVGSAPVGLGWVVVLFVGGIVGGVVGLVHGSIIAQELAMRVVLFAQSQPRSSWIRAVKVTASSLTCSSSTKM